MLPEPNATTGEASISVKKHFARPRLAVLGVVLAAFLAYGSLAHFVPEPRVFLDELLYLEAADSLASGDGLRARDESYARGALYPALLAPILRASPNREVAWELAKLLNALLFALVAIPVYVLSRRLLPPWPSVGAAALSVLVPSSVYVSVVMTESLAYLTMCSALVAIVLAVERPAPWRQITALVAIAVAIGARAQFAILYVAYLLALAFVVLLRPERRSTWDRAFRQLWPTVLSLLLGLLVLVGLTFARGDSPRESLGEYGEQSAVTRFPDLLHVGKWLVYLLADLDLYLAVIPLAVMPIVVASWWKRSRRGSVRHAAFLAVFVSVNAVTLGLVALVASDYERTGIIGMHDRYLFYVAPLWLIVLVAWFAEGLPRPLLAAATGAFTAVLLAVFFPFVDLDVHDAGRLFNAVGSAVPAALGEGFSPSAQRLGTLVLVLALVGAVLAFRKWSVMIATAALVVVFALNAAVVWAQAFELPATEVFADTSRRWVDERVPAGSSVAMLVVTCDEILPSDSLLLTEFFNTSVGRVLALDGSSATFDREGEIFVRPGVALNADYVVGPAGMALNGRRLAEGTSERLVLWHVGGSVRLVGIGSLRELDHAVCWSSA